MGFKGGARTSPGEEPGANDFRRGQKSFPEPLFETPGRRTCSSDRVEAWDSKDFHALACADIGQVAA